MISLSLQEREENILSTIICCNNILSIKNEKKLNYHQNMMKLYESVSGQNNINLEFFENKNQVKFVDFRNNTLPYLKKVNELLENNDINDINVIKSLNENLNSINENFNISNFKEDLSKYIKILISSNDFNYLDSLNPSVLKTKIFSKQPILVYGYDIINHFGLQKELYEQYQRNLTTDLISIIFDKSNKQLLFVFTGDIITYVLDSNAFGHYNQIWLDTWLGDIPNINKIDKNNYFEFIYTNINANIIELYTNQNNLSQKFVFNDNLYSDKKKTNDNLEKYKFRMNNLFFKT